MPFCYRYRNRDFEKRLLKSESQSTLEGYDKWNLCYLLECTQLKLGEIPQHQVIQYSYPDKLKRKINSKCEILANSFTLACPNKCLYYKIKRFAQVGKKVLSTHLSDW